MLFNELGLGNQLTLHNNQLLTNLHKVQERSTLTKSRFLIEEDDTYRFSNFSVMMDGIDFAMLFMQHQGVFNHLKAVI
jgi:hypothetical protein